MAATDGSSFRAQIREKYGLENPTTEDQQDIHESILSPSDFGLGSTDNMDKGSGDTFTLGICGRCAGSWLLITSVFFGVIGLVITTLGVLFVVAPDIYGDSANLVSAEIAITAISFGGVLVIMAIFGFIGTKCEILCCLKAYGYILSIFVMILLIFGILVVTDIVGVGGIVEGSWKGGTDANRASWQNDWFCCGLNDFNDTWASQPCPVNSTDPCLDIAVDDVFQIYGAFGIIYLSVAVLQVITLVLFCYLYSSIKAKFQWDHGRQWSYTSMDMDMT